MGIAKQQHAVGIGQRAPGIDAVFDDLLLFQEGHAVLPDFIDIENAVLVEGEQVLVYHQVRSEAEFLVVGGAPDGGVQVAGVVNHDFLAVATGVLGQDGDDHPVVEDRGLLFGGEAFVGFVLFEDVGFPGIAVAGNFQQGATVAVAGDQEDAAGAQAERGRGHDGGLPFVGAPEQGAAVGGFGGDAADAAHADIDVGFLATQFHRHDGGMTHGVFDRVGGLPEDAAVFHVDAGHQDFFPGRGDDQDAVFDEGALAGVPKGYLGGEELLHVQGPFHRSVKRVAAHHVAFGADGDDVAVADGGDGAGEAVVAFHPHAVPAAPEFLAGFEGEAAEHVGHQGFVIVEDIDAAFVDDGGGVAFACGEGPHFLPILVELDGGGGFGDVGAPITAEAAPDAGIAGRGGLSVVHEELADDHVVCLAGRAFRAVVRAGFLGGEAPVRVVQVPANEQDGIQDGKSGRDDCQFLVVHGSVPYYTRM